MNITPIINYKRMLKNSKLGMGLKWERAKRWEQRTISIFLRENHVGKEVSVITAMFQDHPIPHM